MPILGKEHTLFIYVKKRTKKGGHEQENIHFPVRSRRYCYC